MSQTVCFLFLLIIMERRPDVELVNQDQSLHHLPNNT